MKKLYTIALSVLLISCASLETKPTVINGDTITGTNTDIKRTQEAEAFVQEWLAKYGLSKNIDINVEYSSFRNLPDFMDGALGYYRVENNTLYTVNYREAVDKRLYVFDIHGHSGEFQMGTLIHEITHCYLAHIGLSGKDGLVDNMWHEYVANAVSFDSYSERLQKKLLKKAKKENEKLFEETRMKDQELIHYMFQRERWDVFGLICVLHYHKTNGSYVDHIVANIEVKDINIEN